MRNFNAQQFVQEQLERGASTRYISRNTGVAASTISRIANGKVDPTETTINKLLAPFDYVLCWAHESEVEASQGETTP